MPAETLEEYLKKCQEAHKDEAAAAAKKRQQQAMQDPSFLESAQPQSARCCKSSSSLR